MVTDLLLIYSLNTSDVSGITSKFCTVTTFVTVRLQTILFLIYCHTKFLTVSSNGS